MKISHNVTIFTGNWITHEYMTNASSQKMLKDGIYIVDYGRTEKVGKDFFKIWDVYVVTNHEIVQHGHDFYADGLMALMSGEYESTKGLVEK